MSGLSGVDVCRQSCLITFAVANICSLAHTTSCPLQCIAWRLCDDMMTGIHAFTAAHATWHDCQQQLGTFWYSCGFEAMRRGSSMSGDLKLPASMSRVALYTNGLRTWAAAARASQYIEDCTVDDEASLARKDRCMNGVHV